MKSAKRIFLLTVFLFGFICGIQSQRRPIIGISDFYKNDNNAAVARSYVDAVLLTGGVPVVIPLIQEEDKLIELLNSLDGVVFTGGEDFDPAYYNERPIPQMGKINAPRDKFDIKLLKLASERGIPVLGICRGIQLINITFGGSLYQDLSAQYGDNSIQHRQKQPKEDVSHSVLVEDNTVFSDIVRERMLMVNSSHHQAIKDVAPGFRVAGRSPDRIVEAIEKIDDEHWILGVQFHPEVRVIRDNAMRRIFQRFIEEAGASDNPNRTVKTASQPTPQLRSESSRTNSRARTNSRDRAYVWEEDAEPDYKPNDTPDPVRPIIHQSVIDTQVIYKFVTDTVYLLTDTVYIPADTIYMAARDTQYITVPETQYVYVSDTVYLPIAEATTPTTSKAITSTPETAQSGDDTSQSVSDITHKSADTLIFTPGAPLSTPNASAKENTKAKKKAEKEARVKAEKEAKVKAEKEAKELLAAQQRKQQQALKEQTEKAAAEQDKQSEKTAKEQAKLAKKEAEAKEDQYRKEQIASAKQRKKEIAEKEKMEKAAKKKQAAEQKKVLKERAKKEQEEKEEAARKEKLLQKQQEENAKAEKKKQKDSPEKKEEGE